MTPAEAARFRRENVLNLLVFARELLGGDNHLDLFFDSSEKGYSLFHGGAGAHAIDKLSTREKLGLILLASNVDMMLAVIKEADAQHSH